MRDDEKYYFTAWIISGPYGRYKKVTSTCFEKDQEEQMYDNLKYALRQHYSVRISIVPIYTEFEKFDERF